MNLLALAKWGATVVPRSLQVKFLRRLAKFETAYKTRLAVAFCATAVPKGPKTKATRLATIRAFSLPICVFNLNRRITSFRKLTPDIDSAHDLNPPEAKRFHAKLTNLNIPEIDLAKVFINLLEAENLKSEHLADEDTAFVQLMSPLLFTFRSLNPCG